MSQPWWFVFAGGGTGGHLFPALAVVDALRARVEPIEVSFFCTDRPIDRDVLGPAGVEAVPQWVRPVPSRPWQWPAFLSRWRESLRLCRKIFTRRRPAVVVGAGGYASGPPVHVALRMGIPTFLLNPDAVPGRANLHLARRGGLSGIFAQWDVTAGHFPATAPVEVTGCPVRPAFRATHRAGVGEILRSFELDPHRHTLLVTGASQGARTINETMMQLAHALDFSGWQVLHLAGPGDAERVARAYTPPGSGPGTGRLPGRVLAFTDRMADAMSAADLIVSRAGASTLAEILALGRPSILLPYPYHRDQHQRRNAMVLAEAGAAAFVEDARSAEANVGRLGAVLAQLMKNGPQRSAMGAAARELDRPDAADHIARRVAQTAQNLRGRACEFSGGEPVKRMPRRTA